MVSCTRRHRAWARCATCPKWAGSQLSIFAPDPNQRLIGTLKHLQTLGNTVVVVEHDMAFVRSIARRVIVLHEGHVLAEGDMDKVQNDPRVQDAVTQARIRIVDISELSSGGFNHDRFIQLAAMYPQMAASPDFGVAGTFVLDSAGANDGHIFAPASRSNAGH